MHSLETESSSSMQASGLSESELKWIGVEYPNKNQNPSISTQKTILISSMTAFIFYDEIFKCQEEPNYRQTKYLKLCSGFKSKSFRENKPLIMIIVFKECNEKDLLQTWTLVILCFLTALNLVTRIKVVLRGNKTRINYHFSCFDL